MLEYILPLLDDAILAYNVDEGQYMFISPVTEQILGYPADVLKQNYSLLKNIVHPEDRGKFFLPEDGKTLPLDTELRYRIIAGNNQVKWIRERRVIINRAEDGRRIVIHIIRDVTDDVNYKSTIDHKVWFLSSLINSVGAFIFRVDTRHRYAYVNDVYTNLLGHGKGALLGQPIELVVYPDDLPAMYRIIELALAHPGKVYHIRHRKLTASGDVKWVVTDAVAVADENNRITEIQGVGLDITEQHNAEQEILRTKSNLEALLNNTQDLVWSVDTDMRYVFANTAFKSWIKEVHHVEIHTGAKVNDLNFFSAAVATEWGDYYGRALSGQSFSLNYQETNPQTGITVTFEITFNPIRTVKDEITSIGCFAHDITERLTTQRSVMQQNEKLRSIASLSSHELRRPVATLMGLIDLLDMHNRSNPENFDIIEHIDTVSRELDEVIRLIVNKTFIE